MPPQKVNFPPPIKFRHAGARVPGFLMETAMTKQLVSLVARDREYLGLPIES
jgi:hypothetical protein